MSQPCAVASASFARSSPRCQLWTSLPRFPSGFSRLWSGPATKPSSEIDMWQVVSGIGVLQVIAICKQATRLGLDDCGRVPAAGREGKRAFGQLRLNRLPNRGLVLVLERSICLARGPDREREGLPEVLHAGAIGARLERAVGDLETT